METKYRHEYKYLITTASMELIKQRLNGLVDLDPNVGINGMYNIQSVYFDDYYNTCFYENENGTDPREKFRIRTYNGNTNIIRLECKRKERGKTLKTSCKITEEECRQLLMGRPLMNFEEQSTVLRKLNALMLTKQMKPVVIVSYDRVPYVYKNGNVRITLDMDLSSSRDVTHFLEGNIRKRAVMPKGLHLLEVKWDEFIPDEVYSACQIENLNQTAYSKYYLCRKYYI